MSYQSFEFNQFKQISAAPQTKQLIREQNPTWNRSARRLSRCLGVIALLLISGQGLNAAALALEEARLMSEPILLAQTPLSATILYVNPASGTDASRAGTENTPYRTIAYALRQAMPGTYVQLARGSYTEASGEVFPLTVPPGVVLRGEESEKGQTVAIIGGGNLISPTFARQNVTLQAGKDTEIRGISVTNPNLRGTGIWVESVNARIQNCTFNRNNREGIFIMGTANPVISGSVFTQNGGNGISVANRATGEISGNVFQNTGFGLAIGGSAAPRVNSNRIIENTDGLYINDSARPILRNNVIENNKRDGIVATINAQPDLGTSGNDGNNTVRNNRQYDLNNTTNGTLYSVGNTMDPRKVSGRVAFVAPAIASGDSEQFTDVQGHWAQAYIAALAKRKIISGFPGGTFHPDDPVTRVQFAAIVDKAFAPSAKQSATRFKDVNSSFWGYSAIQSAARGQFMRGYPNGAFRPNQAIPRVEVLVALANGLSFNASSTGALSKYRDAAQIPSWATTAVAAATQRKIVVNYPTLVQLNPTRNATRAEVAAFVYQAMVNAGKANAIASPYIVMTP
jgi:parallel beta-helix repeat protein